MNSTFVPKIGDNSFESNASPAPKAKKITNMAMSVIPGQFIGNTRKLEKSKNNLA
jgi:hypothetical protein